MESEAEARLEHFIARYAPEVAETARGALDRLRRRLPWADLLVYDNYNALAVGFSPSDRAGDALISIALYPRWANLFFLHGATLDDPAGLLSGKGSRVRHVRLAQAGDVDRPEIQALIDSALSQAGLFPPPDRVGRAIIKSVVAKQRPRQPGA